MVRSLYRIWSCVLLLAASAMMSVRAAGDGIIETFTYKVCAGDTMTITTLDPSHKLTVYKDTSWYDTISVADPSMDSIYQYVVNIVPRYEWTEYKQIHPEDSLVWHDTVLYNAGTYERFFKSVDGCDSIFRLHLSLTQDETGYHFMEWVTICEDEDFIWRGRSGLNKTGIGQTTHYFDRYHTAPGQDSIYELVLTVNPVVRTTRTIPFCGSIEWNGELVTETKKMVDTLMSIRYGCDSIITTILAKGIPFHQHDTVTIHPGEIIEWRGLTITHDGLYEDRYTSSYGCDSIYTLGVGLLEEVPVTPMRTFYETSCDGVGFDWRDKTYFISGRYTDTVKTASGEVDTLYVLVLTVYPNYQSEERVSFHHYPVNYRGAEIAEPMDTTFHYMTVHGCDSAITVHLDREVVHVEQSATICYGDEYEWYGMLCKETKRYVYIEQDDQGRDSVEHVLNLTVINLPDQYMTHTMCQGSSFTFYDRTLTEAGEYTYDSYENGCKQTIHLSLNVLIPDTVTDIAHIDEGGQYVWPRDGHTYRETGVYYKFGTNRLGCDSVNVLILTINHVDTIDSTAVICAGETIEWHGIVASQTGDYSHADLAASGNYNFYRLHLTVREQVPDFIRHLYACGNGATITYNEEVFDHDTVVISHFASVHGCDSVEKVYLHFGVSNFYSDTVVLTDQQLPYTWTYQLPGEKPDTVLTNAGTFHHRSPGEGTCYNYEELVLIIRPTYLVEEHVVVCENDLPYYWLNGPASEQSTGLSHETGTTKKYEYRETSIYGTDSIFRLWLTVAEVYDTTIYVHGCQNTGVVWQGKKYDKDTSFVARIPVVPYNPLAPCDSVFHVHIIMDTVYTVRWDTTLCEYQLPLIVGRVNPDTIWEEKNFRHESDLTSCGCDSIIEGHLTIIPSLTHNDSTFACEDDIIEHPVVLGNTEHPAFLDNDGSKWEGKWEGKWKGIEYRQDTIVWDCDHRYFHHIIVRPHQAHIPDTTYYLCPGDSVQLFWPKETWIKKPGVYLDTVPTISDWQDTEHHTIIHNDRAYACDSVTRWTVKYAAPVVVDTVEKHIALGDSIWWGGRYCYYDGYYDSICDYKATKLNGKDSVFCKETHWLHLFADTVHYYVDTISICHEASKQYAYTWADGHTMKFITPVKDTAIFHVYDTLKPLEYDFYDRYYDLVVYYSRIYKTQLYDTICEGTDRRFDIHRGTTTIERHLKTKGVYHDTITATNGCDSILILYLETRDSIPTRHLYKTVTDRELPYEWVHTWKDANGQDTTHIDSLYATGAYTFTVASMHGCDSTEILHFTVHRTHVFRDTIEVCSEINKTMHHHWSTGYVQTYTLPLADDTIHYYDTLDTRIKLDSIYDLLVNYHAVTVEYRDSSICEGDSIRFGLSRAHSPRFIFKSGIYRDTLTRVANGCDSIIELRLNVYPRHLHHETAHIADIDTPYVWHHIQGGDTIAHDTLYAEGEYIFRFNSEYSCDSIDSLSLRIHKTYLIEEDTITICQSETPYTWQDRNDIQSDCDLRFSTLTTDGYDSIRTVHITVLPLAYTTVVKDICEGDSIKFGGRMIGEQGTYYDTLQAANSCDSIVTLVLKVNPLKRETDYKTIYEGDSIEFHGQWYKESGIYEYKELNATGCEDIHLLILTVLKQFYVDTTAYVCDNELPFIWRGYGYSESGDYKLSTLTDSSRVVTTLHLTVNPTFYEERNVDICEGDIFSYKGKEYTTNGFFYDTIPSRTGCDSVLRYIVSVHPVYDYTYEKHISDKQPYDFHGRTLTNSGTYEWTDKTVNGCDSMEHLILIVHPSYFFSDTIDLCQSDSLNIPYEWRGFSISASGVYTDSILTSYGFDSVYQLVVHIHPSYLINEQYEISEGEILKIHGRDISTPAIYYDTLRTIHGCDSIFHIVVNLRRTREFSRTAEICQGEYYDFFGRKLTHSGNYTYVSEHKDSIVYLTLTVWPTSISETRIVIPDTKTTYIYNGQLYENLHLGDNLFTDTLINQYGCDSIARLIICMTTHYSEWIPLPLCPGSEIKIDGMSITKAGLYTFERRSKVTGEMDSLYRVEVYDAPAYEFPEETIYQCEGDTFRVGDKIITRGGHYDITLKTQEGCDSIYHYTVVVYPSYHLYTDVTIRDFETYTWAGKTYKDSGTYVIPANTIHGCDSICTLHLNVITTERFFYKDTICDGQEYVWRGDTFRTDGYYTDTVYYPSTFYSAIHTLDLRVMHPTHIKNAKISEICADDTEFSIEFTYSGAKPAVYSIYFDRLAKSEGFEDVINKPFLGEDGVARARVPSKSEVIYLDHTEYVRPNTYTMRLVLDNGICGISRSDSIQLNVRYPSWIIEQNWDDVIAPLRKELNGGYEFSQMDWYVNGILQPNNGLGYLHSDKLNIGDEVVMMATRKGESYAIPTCPLVITEKAPDVYENPILVYPSLAPRHAPRITIEAPQGGSYSIYSSTGTFVTSGDLSEGKQQVTLPNTCGLYFIRTVHEDQAEVHKIVLY